MAKVLLINPMVREEDLPKHIPYGISELAAIAMEAGHLVQIYDENAWRKGADVMAQVCAADDWDVIAIGGLTTAYTSIKIQSRWRAALCLARSSSPGAVLSRQCRQKSWSGFLKSTWV